jgi:hypothetical protein
MTNDNFIRRYARHLRTPEVSRKCSAKLDRQVEQAPRPRTAVGTAEKLRDIADQIERSWGDLPR